MGLGVAIITELLGVSERLIVMLVPWACEQGVH